MLLAFFPPYYFLKIFFITYNILQITLKVYYFYL
nr:MAG TPA: hypothetical protein [Caudoviricetes sp.]